MAIFTREVLIIVDGLNTAWQQKFPLDSTTYRFRLLPLGIGAEAYSQRFMEQLRHYHVEIISIDHIAEEAQHNLQDQYPSFIYKLAHQHLFKNKSLLDMLTIKEANLWWLMETSEKSVFRCSLVNHLYFLELVQLTFASHVFHEVWLDITCKALRQTLQSFTPKNGASLKIAVCKSNDRRQLPRVFSFLANLILKRMYTFFRLVSQRYLLVLLNIPNRIEKLKILICGVYPVMWVNPFTAHPMDRTYGILASVLGGWKKTGYLVTIQLSCWKLWTLRKQIRMLFNQMDIIPLIRFGTMKDLLTILGPSYLYKIVRTEHAVRRMNAYIMGSYNIAPLILEELRCSLTGSELALNLVRIKCLQRLLKEHHIDFLIHWGEFQPVEKAIWYGAKNFETRTVSFQHSTCTPMFLCYHFGENEIGQYLEQPTHYSSMPLPNLFTTTGYYAAQALQDSGFPPERIHICGGIRYRKLLEHRLDPPASCTIRKDLNVPKDNQTILLATTSKITDNLTMAEALASALKNEVRPTSLLIKCHPLLPKERERQIATLIAKHNPNIHCIVLEIEYPLHNLLSVSDVMLTNSSATGLEAIALGIMPIFFHNPYLYDLSALYSLRHSILLASNLPELSSALEVALHHPKTLEEKKAHWQTDLDQIFYRIDTQAESRLLSFLKSQEPPALPKGFDTTMHSPIPPDSVRS